jgi:hypothetical protein
MPLITGDKSEKAVFVFLNVVLAIAWVYFLIHLIARWSITGLNIRVPVGLFMMFFTFWWITSIRENRRAIPLLMAGSVFVTVTYIVKMLM